MLKPAFLLLLGAAITSAIVLVPPNRNLALGRKIHSSFTCGEVNGQPIREMYCTIAASAYTPHNQYSYSMADEDGTNPYRQARMEKQSFVQGGQNCDFCEANSSYAHPASNMVDGSPSWWQSPPLSRGIQYNEVNITIDLEQEFHVAYVWIQMANSPRPGTWILERSVDYGLTYTTWQYFAASPAECSRRFGTASLRPIEEDDSVICTHEFSQIHPMENGEIVINLLENRPGKNNFSHSPVLQNFARATNVRLRLLKTKTLQGQLMDLNENNDPTVTRRYYYAIKEIMMGGRCVCNGHADSCDVLDVNRPRTWLCRCDHNTCGDSCDKCCPGFEQKKWHRAREGHEFVCEPCNCHGHSNTCVYEEELDEKKLSLDIHGEYNGGGRCLDCRHNTQGINCNECVDGYYRPESKSWNETDVCQRCVCDPAKHNGKCAEITGKCECLPQFTGENCDQCSPGYYDPPTCKPCQCNINGTDGEVCLAQNEQCPCKVNYSGKFCDECASGYTNITKGCIACTCDDTGSRNNDCDKVTEQCECKQNFGGKLCDTCAKGYYNYPACDFCDCDPSGTEGEVCDMVSGQCLCKAGFAGKRCDQCDVNHYGYPNCRSCNCDSAGSKNVTCDLKTGECPCHSNFTGRTCDKCAAGFYNYPKCLSCDCVLAGSKGLTCDNDGQCYCKPNFVGKHCDQCKPNFYNFPVCEECNCNPNGVAASFAGCDKVAPGELCTCKENVIGRTCNECKPTFWDLQYYHNKGCVDCACNMTGTVSLLNNCNQNSGQCACKRYVQGQKCDHCVDGFYQLEVNNHVGCQPCNCDIGGSVGHSCNMASGQCRCKPRVEGIKCNETIKDHYYPTLWHMKYEAEEARLPDNSQVRYAIDENQFPEFSWKGFTVFSPIQNKIYIDVDIRKSSVYKLLLHYLNPTSVPIDVEISVAPVETSSADFQQNITTTLPIAEGPATVIVNDPLKPFVLNPGRWRITFQTSKRLFLDYIVLLPAEYYDASLLSERIYKPCIAKQNESDLCIDLLYPPLPTSQRIDSSNTESFKEVDADGNGQPLKTMTVDDLPDNIGQAILVESGKSTKAITIDIPVPEDGTYYAVLEYFNPEPYNAPLKVQITQDESTAADGVIALNHCPYAGFCRELLTADGKAALLGLKKSPPNAIAHITVQPDHHFGIVAVNLVKEDNWNNDYLKQYEVCIRRNGQCEGLFYPPPPNAIVTEAESGRNANNSIAGDKLPFNIVDDKNVQLMSLDNVQSTLEISGVVTVPGQYVFVIHYYNPDNTPLNLDIMVQNDRFADADFHYCPTVTGCRTVVFDKQTSNNNLFPITDKYSLTLYFNQNQKGPIYIDSVTAVPYQYYRDNIVKPLPIYKSNEFFERCSANHFENNPKNVSDYCQQKIFALTVDFNNGAVACGCNAHGSHDFGCEDYGGQCKCKANIIGRTCDRCAPGHYSFPNCLKCRCGINQQCDERSGQCFCPLHVEGINCDKCVSSGFGFDPLIGCQLCGCHPDGSYNGELRCDANNGQCLCKENVGGRQCDRCIPGYYGFPNCYPCQCNIEGTTEAICDEATAQCICKKNVQGVTCDQCVAGTFFLRAADTDGCSDCFCFDVTDRCVSSTLPVNIVNFDDQSWKTDDPNGNVSGFRGVVTYSASGEAPENVYFVHESGNNRDYTTSYGLTISFIIASFKSDNNSFKSNSADVKLISGNNIIEYWAAEQPHDPSQRFTVRVPLLPDVWLLPTGEPTSRAKMMMILRNLTSIAVKASYYAQPIKAIMEQFEIEVGGGNNFDSPVTASSVEVCQCPPPYTGNSCQFCAPGYYRVKSDSLTGTSCVPCNCYGHTGTCDPDTGVCEDCQHNTVGEHCESCMEGFYGNSTNGSPYACLACACPHATPTNNFAVSCDVSETGNLQSCNCKPGFSGDRCEICDVGYYGDPLTYAGTCESCFCNNNNNLTEYGSCNPQTGDCALCKDNTDGRNCEYCKPWYYGDAVTAKNCTECSCNQCGSYNCDNVLGKCKCQPYVQGENCDKCVENAWGFDSCQGCRMCDCGTAASNSQCDLKTGQCACMPGADGMRCDRCKHGFWNYGAEGCKKCDCEADLSMGTVCDVNTGHCHCQEGATGHRCDSCLDGFLRIPTLGCRQCDECVFALNSELDGLAITADALNTTLSNVSSTALTGARIHRINKNIEKFKPQLQLIIDHRDGNSEMHKFQSTFDKALDDASKIDIQAERLDEQFKNMNEILKNTSTSVKRLQSDARDLYSVTNWVIHGIGLMANEYRTRPPIQNREQLIAEGEKFLEKLRNTTFDLKIAEMQKVYDESVELEKLIQSWENKSQNQSNEVTALNEKLTDLKNITKEFERELQGIHRTATEAGKIMESLPFFQINALINGIEKDSQAAQGFIEAHESLNRKLVDIENQLRDFTDTLKKDITELNQGSENVKATMSKRRRKKRTVEKTNQQLLDELKQNEQKALALMGIYDAARLESKTFVDATHIYEDLLSALADARNYSTDAIAKSHEAGNDAQGIAETSKKLSEQSQQLSSNIKKILTEDMNELTGKKDKLDERLKNIVAKAESFWAFINSTGMNPEDIKKLEAAVTAIINTEDKMASINSTTSELTPKVEEIAAKVGKLIEGGNEYQIALDKSKAQLGEAEKQIPVVAQKIEALDERLNKNEKVLSEYALKIVALKEKIALARDKTNMIKLSAHFEPSSHLELPLSQQNNDVSVYTDIRFFFRTPRDTGTLLYLGNEEGNNDAEYISLEINDRKPKLVINLGNGPITTVLPTEVNDNQWRELIVRRAGGHAIFEVSKPNTDETDQHAELSVKDTNAVLNLDSPSQRILLGGFPQNFRVPSAISHRTFTGDVDTLRINGMLIGLWNGKKVGNVLGAPHRPPVAYETSEENAVSFDGNGYLQIGTGSYNLRKRTTVLLSFMTYSPDGLLFFVGKDNDQLVVELTGGRVSLSFDLGSGAGRVISSNDNYNDGKWHIVHINRVERRAKLEVDGLDVAEGESPGTMFEMSVSDSIYLGGLPQGVEAYRFTVQPFRGCLKNLKIDADYANLAHSKEAKGIQPSCPYTHVRVASTISERARMTLGKLSAKDTFDLSIRFRTEQTNAHIISVLSAENENLLQANLDNGKVIVGVNGDDEKVEVPLSSVSDGSWHYLTITRKNDEIIVTLDDSVTRKGTVSDAADYLPSDALQLRVGKHEDGKYFIGCLADVVWNGALTNFAMYTANEVKLTECTMQSSMVNKTVAPSSHNDQIEKGSKVLPTEDVMQVTTAPTPKTSSVPSPARKPDECALHLVPHGLREDSAGFRFGTQKGSRLEFDRASGDLDRNLIFSVQLRAIATNGFILFVSNEKQTDFITMFLNNGLVNFMFGQPNYYVHLVSNTSMLDNEWHTVRVEREGSAAALYVDGNQEANNQSIGLENLEVQPPLFIGGLSQESVPIRSKIFNNRKELPIRSEFGGCLRDFKINGKKFDNPAREIGVVPCSEVKESGIFFGKEGGHAVLDPEFVFTSNYALEMEIRPRTKNALLLSVGVLEFASVQLVDGNVVFMVDIGSGSYNVTSSFNVANAICDGHWHHIKVTMKKNIITISVDQRSGMTFIKKNKDVIGKDKLYFGGIPRGMKLRNPIQTDPYVGCVRNVAFLPNAKNDGRIEYDMQNLATFGDVIKDHCPLN